MKLKWYLVLVLIASLSAPVIAISQGSTLKGQRGLAALQAGSLSPDHGPSMPGQSQRSPGSTSRLVKYTLDDKASGVIKTIHNMATPRSSWAARTRVPLLLGGLGEIISGAADLHASKGVAKIFSKMDRVAC